MSYLNALVETYTTHSKAAGTINFKKISDEIEMEYMLLPISHTTQVAQIEVDVTIDGEFFEARVIEKENTVIPFTEASGSRTSTNFAPHALHDKLMYVAGDFTKYMSDTKHFDKKRAAHHQYLANLKEWCESEYKNERVCAIYNYLKKGTLTADLVKEHILFLNDENKLISKWPIPKDKNRPKIFSVLSGDQESVFVRFNVVDIIAYDEKVWNDKEIHNSYIRFYETKLTTEELCYVQNKSLPFTEKHPSKIRNAADMAKLISANDSDGFTYRGRFTEASEVAIISYEASQKAHNALKWLIIRQGKIVGDRVFLVWGQKEIDIPAPSDSLEYIPDTQEIFAAGFNEALNGKLFNAKDRGDICMLALDSATTGRLAVVNYRLINSQTYFDRLCEWGKTCSWPTLRKVENMLQEKILSPSLYEIAVATYGAKADKKIFKYTIERLLPCVIDNRKLPHDIVNRVVERASTPTFFNDWGKTGKFEWEQTLFVACALVRKINKKGAYGMTLEETNLNNQTRSYLFGRLLAVADVLESGVLKKKEEKRLTNAMRLKRAFSSKPATTWAMIDASLEPYMNFLIADSPGLYITYQNAFDEIFCKLEQNDFVNNERLSPEFLLGFAHQRKQLYTKKDVK